MSAPSLEDRARWRRMAAAAPGSGLVTLRASGLLGLLDHAEAVEGQLAELRREVGEAIAVARAAPHTHDGRPCSSGLDHLPAAPAGHAPGCTARMLASPDTGEPFHAECDCPAGEPRP